ncbi:MAG: potassium transporter TrkG [Oscillospiraceae bacterium]
MREKFHILSRRHLNPTRIVVGSFAAIIILGALLLTLPIASKSGQSAGFFTGLFTATSATCVTGLILVDTFTQWTVFGQAVILCMIQMGGLGFMTVITLVSFVLHRRIGLSERLIMVSTLNLNDMSGVVRVVRNALIGTLVFEGTGAAILSLRFIPEYGLVGGIWRGIFHAVSAFCNAGFDLLGSEGPFSSMVTRDGDPVVLITLMCLIVIGGLGFFVWADIRESKRWRKYATYTKLVLGITAVLIVVGAVFFLVVEWNNPKTIGEMPLWKKVLNSFFQSVTLRTCGFNSIDQGALQDSSKAAGILLMLVGGSSGSTAGGIKTVTMGVLLLALRAGMHGSDEVTIGEKTISSRRVINAMTLVLIVLFIFFGGSMILSVAEGLPFLDCGFEIASALGTVGVTTGMTPSLSALSRIVVMCCMFIGRVGIMSFSIAFLTHRNAAAKIKYPHMDIMIG